MDRDAVQHTNDIEAIGRTDALQTRRLLIARLKRMIMVRVIYPPFRKEIYHVIDLLAKEIGLDDG